LTWFTVVLGADQLSKYLWATPVGGVAWVARARIGMLALLAVAMFVTLAAGATRAGLLSPVAAGAAIAGGVSLLIDRATVGAPRILFESSAGVDDLATLAVATGAVLAMVGVVRSEGSVADPVGAGRDLAGRS
jgi:hypothetical protein